LRGGEPPHTKYMEIRKRGTQTRMYKAGGLTGVGGGNSKTQIGYRYVKPTVTGMYGGSLLEKKKEKKGKTATTGVSQST